MENDFESRRSGAHCVAQVDMCCLGCQTLGFGGIFVFGLAVYAETQDKLSNATLAFFAIVAVLTLLFVAVDFFAINRLRKASRENNEISTEKALAWTRFWFNLSVIYLVIGILIQLIPFKAEKLIGLAVGVIIRVYMLTTVNKYMEALEKRLLQNPTQNV